MKSCLALLFLFFSFPAFGQADLENDIGTALQNAKKGIYWALNNIPEKKNKSDNDLIADNKLFASVKLSKEINGLKIESSGFFNSYSVTVKFFRSNENLIKDGYIKPKSTGQTPAEDK